MRCLGNLLGAGKCGNPHICLGASGGLAVLWNPKVIQGWISDQEGNWQLIDITSFDMHFKVLNVYGPTTTIDKKNLWDKLSQIIQQDDEPRFIIGGDFNALLSH